jgi:alkylation response protein AidB-like acyl-CoA dehydrogenase
MNAPTSSPETSYATDAADIKALLRQSLETVLSRHYSFEKRREAHNSATRYSAAAWDAYAELGLLAMGLPEEHGGLSGDLSTVAMAAELMGGALTLEPYRATMVAARLLAASGTPDQQAKWLPAFAAGTSKAALAHAEGAGRMSDPIQANAVRVDSNWRINGKKTVVLGGDAADLFIVSARVADEMALFLVPAEQVEQRGYGCFDWQGAADISLKDVLVPVEARLAGGQDALERAMDEAIVLACADALGAMRAANILTRDYARNRKQFGVAISSFQVLQHRMVDMAIAEELAAAINTAAIDACAGSDASARARAVSAAKVKVGDSARYVAQQCVHIHGGMGLTEEYPASHYFARLGLFERMFGDRDDHLQRFAAMSRQ